MVSANVRDMEQIIARTALKYDLLPYASNPFPQTLPSRTGAVARLFGLDAAPMSRARVLELGCAAGGNIVPLAHRYPEAKFVGVDLSRTQVAAGRDRIAALGLNNIEILCQSFTELDSSIGTFDYIICHGVYSWVPTLVRDAILRISRERLSDTGVVYISYNVLPGWRLLQALRDSFLLEVPDHTDSKRRVAQARELLAFMREASPDGGAYKQVLETWQPRLAQLPDDYVAHEFLEEVNEPCTVTDFVRDAGRHGLAYLGETEVPGMILDNLLPETARRVRERSGSNLVATEQTLDLLTGRTFRQSLLVAAGRQNEINRNLTPERVTGMHFLGGGGIRVERTGQGGTLTDAAGRSLSTTSSPVFEALGRVVARCPASSSISDMLADLPAAQREMQPLLQEALFKMALCGLMTLSTEPVPAPAGVGERPMADGLARSDAERREASTTNLRHERVMLDPAALAVLPSLDGTNDRVRLAAVLASQAKAGRLQFSREGTPVNELAAIDATALAHIDAVLAGIAQAGLLVG